ncbi:uncharacterized protein LOC115884329 [Sitophilus oryzae]|uniref:Uncharacterized protein LOC115884329 n=1 Tax=Sitophilus oryzae TaxID=7048 RepID=A0A6J2Y6Y7_SITOR|nr:uncharacterized protein LOC115884329 [Sitophilus oryzae]
MDNEYQALSKLSGYLEKKGRKKMMSCYKKYWFVLEGRLLLYYKSKDEYEAISPCKGSITLGATCNVKPCTSNVGVFQIENKTTTITLRAESREEQHKWMHAIISALNQGNNGTKLCHFRHSLGELPPDTDNNGLRRNETLKKSNSCSSPKENRRIIEKLQKLGAQSYGIESKTQGLQNLLTQKRMSVSHESLPLKVMEKRLGLFRKSEDQSNNHFEKDEDVSSSKSRSSSTESWKYSGDAMYDRIQSNESVFIKSEDEVNTENQYYCGSRQHNQNNSSQEMSEESRDRIFFPDHNTDAVVTDNNYYWSRKSDSVYDKDDQNIDCNDNNIQKHDMIPSLSAESLRNLEHVYFEPIQLDNSKSNEYVDMPVSPDPVKDKSSKIKKRFNSFYKRTKKCKEKPDEGLRKSESFLKRVWARKIKKKEKEISLTNNNALQKMEMNDTTTVQMLTALQEILENKKQELREKLKGETLYDSQREEMIYQEVQSENIVPANSSSEEDNIRPSLPPRNCRKKSGLPNHITAEEHRPEPRRNNNNFTTSIDDILNNLNLESQHRQKDLTVDNKDENEGNVKKLIKRFSIAREDSVEMRIKKNWDLNDGKRETCSTDSGELNRLLDELAKVTTAPIMTPGVTTSLINPEICDSELFQLIPMRRRRMSDPDYDIPRPHRSLTNVQRKDENALQATRFFGPILRPSDLIGTTKRPPTPPVDYSNVPSMTPDSLEVNCRKSLNQEDQNTSYQSHDYVNYQKRSHNRVDVLVENALYEDPRLVHKSKQDYIKMNPHMRNLHYNSAYDNEFIDSLET